MSEILKRETGISLTHVPTTSTPEELTRMIRDEGRHWAQLIKERNITVD